MDGRMDRWTDREMDGSYRKVHTGRQTDELKEKQMG